MNEAPPWRIKPLRKIPRRANIYLPNPLTERMDRLREQGIEIATSRVCQDALWEACNMAEAALPKKRLSNP
jgi:hypothetical protein